MDKESKQRRELASLVRLAVELEGTNIYFREQCLALELETGTSMRPLVPKTIYTGDELASATVCHEKIREQFETVKSTHKLLREALEACSPSSTRHESNFEADYFLKDYKLRFDS